MMDILNDISTWSILKWVVIVLVAGFIGQFGKTMAQAVLGRMRRLRAPKGSPPGTESARPITAGKAAPPSPLESPPAPAPGRTGITDKKTMKILAKQQKKAAKQASKKSAD